MLLSGKAVGLPAGLVQLRSTSTNLAPALHRAPGTGLQGAHSRWKGGADDSVGRKHRGGKAQRAVRA